MSERAGNLQAGDYGLWRTPWPARVTPHSLGVWLLGWIIRWATRSDYNHAVLYLGNGVIGEAASHGFAIHHCANLDAYAWSSGLVGASNARREQIVAAAYAMEGTPYGYLDIVALGLSTRGLHSAAIFKRLNSRKTSICSQAVARCWDAADVSLVKSKFACEVTPGDLDDVRLGKAVPLYW